MNKLSWPRSDPTIIPSLGYLFSSQHFYPHLKFIIKTMEQKMSDISKIINLPTKIYSYTGSYTQDTEIHSNLNCIKIFGELNRTHTLMVKKRCLMKNYSGKFTLINNLRTFYFYWALGDMNVYSFFQKRQTIVTVRARFCIIERAHWLNCKWPYFWVLFWFVLWILSAKYLSYWLVK